MRRIRTEEFRQEMIRCGLPVRAGRAWTDVLWAMLVVGWLALTFLLLVGKP